jgi:Lactate racemase N-terminal domain
MADDLRMFPVRQQLYSAPLADIPAAVRDQLCVAGLEERVRPGQRIAITAGSRGITNIAAILKATVESVKAVGGQPFIVPAMGSHGGATAEGQAEVLATFGITEERMGAPVLSSMEVVELGHTERGTPVYLDRNAAGADGIIVVNRVKTHTDFKGPYESGLMKMITIGLGKRVQAESIHAYLAWGLQNLIPEVGRAKIRLAPIQLALGILEDGYDQTCEIVGLKSEEIEAREPELLVRAKEYMARLPFDDIDLLIVDQIGKEISGAGMDPNVIGRLRIPGEPEFERPRVERLVVLDLTEETHGNGIGTGLADFTTQKLVDKIDWHVTNTNSVVSGFLLRSMVPVVSLTDRAAIESALFTLRRKPVEDIRVMRIRNTLHLEQLQLSAAFHEEADGHPRIQIDGEPAPMHFDIGGNLM